MIAKENGVEVSKRECFICKEDHDFPPKGDGTGNSLTLGNNLGNRYNHDWQLKNRTIKDVVIGGEKKTIHKYPNSTIQAHHIIPSTVIKNGKSGVILWKKICDEFGFDINKPDNGTWLPSEMPLACQLEVPLHRGGHPKGYYLLVEGDIQLIMDDAANKMYCPNNHSGFVSDLDTICGIVFDDIKDFFGLLTSDGLDYKSDNIGCAGVTSVSGKPQKECNREHGFPVKKQSIIRGK